MARIGFGLDSYVFHSGKYHILLPTLPPAYQTLITVVLPGPRGPFSRVQDYQTLLGCGTCSEEATTDQLRGNVTFSKVRNPFQPRMTASPSRVE
jgi:hypothetical protein